MSQKLPDLTKARRSTNLLHLSKLASAIRSCSRPQSELIKAIATFVPQPHLTPQCLLRTNSEQVGTEKDEKSKHSSRLSTIIEQERLEQENQDHHKLERQQEIWKEVRSQGDPRGRESQKEGHLPPAKQARPTKPSRHSPTWKGKKVKRQ